MRIVLEIGDWCLAEDDEGEVRLWSNGVTGETKAYEDVPPEVEAHLASSSAAEPPAAPPAEPPAQPFRRACGAAAAPAADVAPGGFTRQRGLAAAPAPQQGSAPPEPLGATLLPPPLAAPAPDAQEYVCWDAGGFEAGGCEASDQWPVDEASPWPDAAPAQPGARPLEPVEPEPVVARPADLVELPLREPSTAMLTKATSMRQNTAESSSAFLLKLTHLHLAEKKLTSLGAAFHLCPKLRVLNLEGNHLQELSGLRPICEVLHLQGNDLWDLTSEWTQNLPSLVTLKLQENRLTVLAGLRSCHRLEELNLRGQRTEMPLQLHPPTLKAFARTLRTLDISRNRMTDADIAPVASLMMLERLDAASNMLTNMPSIGSVLQSLRGLKRLCMEENPVCWMRKYRDLVIVAAGERLEHLDGKDVQPNERPFLVELHQRRRRRNSSEPPRQRASPAGSNQGALTPLGARSSSLTPQPPSGYAPAPPVPCMARGPRSRSSSVDPAARHYRRKVAPAATKLPPLLPRI